MEKARQAQNAEDLAWFTKEWEEDKAMLGRGGERGDITLRIPVIIDKRQIMELVQDNLLSGV